MLHFYQTKNFLKSINKKENADQIRRKLDELSKGSDFIGHGSVSSYSNNLFVLRLKGPHSRTLIEQKNIDIEGETICVYFVRDVVSGKRYDYQWSKVYHPSIADGHWLDDNPLSIVDINDFKKSYLANKNKKPLVEKKTILPEKYSTWLTDFSLKVDYSIYESQIWLDYCSSDISDKCIDLKQINLFKILLRDVFYGNENSGITIKEHCIIPEYYFRIAELEQIRIFYVINKKEDKLLLLFGADSTQDAYWNEHMNKLDSYESHILKNGIPGLSFRAYPDWVLKSSDNTWQKIELENSHNNLSLLNNQLDFLNRFKFPQYINGQAGSGKSTMLTYLFSNVYYYKCLESFEGQIIFLTENENLLERTKDEVFELLRTNPEYSGLSSVMIEDVLKYFKTFRDYLWENIPVNYRKNFEYAKYLDYATFKYLYENNSSFLRNSELKKITAEEAWFAITTFFIGADIKKDMSSDDYNDFINKREVSLPLEKIKSIERHILPYYHKLISEDKYWTRLSLIKYFHVKKINQQKLAVIFCDEAQDFTKIELQYIFNLSIYLNFDLRSLNQIPIVFAGDPNQTVNPTGFKVSELKQLWRDELSKLFSANDVQKLVYESEYNFRSSEQIVDLANCIQIYRSKDLGLRQDIKQKSRSRIDDSKFNTFFTFDMLKNNKDISKNFSFKTYIVPQDQNTQFYYKDILEKYDIEPKTSIQVKGSEYEYVVLWGFGKYFLENISLKECCSNEENFQMMFFYNKLYVAVTRAKKELIIIDSDESIDGFWKKLIVPTYSENISFKPESLGHLSIAKKENAVDDAKNDFERGVEFRNISTLQSARAQFIRLNLVENKELCDVEILKIKEKWSDASEMLIKLAFKYEKESYNEKAANLLWQNNCYENLLEKIPLSLLKTKIHELRLVLTRLILESKIEDQFWTLINNNLMLFDKLINTGMHKLKIVEKLCQILVKEDNTNKNYLIPNVFKSIIRNRDGINEELVENSWSIIGLLYFRLGYYKDSIDAWKISSRYVSDVKVTEAYYRYYRSSDNESNNIIWTVEYAKILDENDFNQMINRVVDLTNTINYSNLTPYAKLSLLELFLYQKKLDTVNEILGMIESSVEVEELSYSELADFLLRIVQSRYLSLDIKRIVFTKYAICIFYDEFGETNEKLDKINSQLLKVLNKQEDLYTVNELKGYNLKDLWRIQDNKIEHPDHFMISNYRQFEEITVDNLSNVNLLLGDNNIGKTSILELIWATNLDSIIDALKYSSLIRYGRFNIPDSYILDFFHNWSDSESIKLSLSKGRNNITYMLKYIEDNVVELQRNGGANRKVTFDKNAIECLSNNFIPYVPFGSSYDSDLAIQYQQIQANRKLRLEFYENLRFFIPLLENITLDGNRIIIEEENDKVGPLSQYGEGANKLFRILITIYMSKNKIVCIDEIDTGIHFSRFVEFWKIIIKAAMKNNVQLFASTHNIECVIYFKDALSELKDSIDPSVGRTITFHKNKNGHIFSVTRLYENFEYELENEFELRGGQNA